MEMRKSFLLPHRYQIIGWGLVVAALPIAIAMIAGDITGVIHNIPAILGWIPAFAGLLLICMSQEKVDDEYIRTLRSRLVCILVSVAVIASILKLIFEIVCCSFGLISYIYSLNFVFTLFNPIVLMVIYVIVFKSILYIQNRKINRYAE